MFPRVKICVTTFNTGTYQILFVRIFSLEWALLQLDKALLRSEACSKCYDLRSISRLFEVQKPFQNDSNESVSASIREPVALPQNLRYINCL